MTKLILDGSNLCHEGQKKQGKFKSLGALLPCLRALLENEIEAYVIFDASFRYRLEKDSEAARAFETLLKEDERFTMAPAGTPADVFILEFAALRDFGVLSNDTFRQYVERKGKDKEPFFNGKPIRLHSFQMLMGAFVVPSLRISYLIDDDALRVEDIIAERDGAPRPAKAPAGAAAPAKPAGPAKAPKAKPDETGGQPEAQEPEPHAGPGPLDFLLELSPLFLRSGDAFEVYRNLTGKPWKAGNSRKTAEAFAGECFSQDIVYVEPAGQKKNDGYFFDARYGAAKHAAVRDYLLEANRKMLPLIASPRVCVLQLLELIHDRELAAGFDLGQLRGRAQALGLAYYDRYLWSLLFALVAADGLRGTDESETDIATILKGEMRVNPDENQSDMLNFYQRGVLYLLADSDNKLPEVIRANMGWIFQLPRDDKRRRTIIRGHLDWLALDDTQVSP
ncbi:MAG: hypothetical protein QOH47_2455 [Sphingomonadales bacterium]|jgi:hypothetical protein|nr:hypothetical protein [Sphingomonadales bacterium]